MSAARTDRVSGARYPVAMRIIYSTPRLENAEKIARMLEDDGVGVRLLYGPHFRRNTWKGANYRQAGDPGNWPRVMVLNNGDLPRARDLLRKAGVLPPAAFDRLDGNADEVSVFLRARSLPADPLSAARVVRVALIIAVLVVAVIQFARRFA